MKQLLRSALFTLIAGIHFNVHAQLSVSYPLERAVFQRDNNNSATIFVAGNISQIVDRIEVQFRPIRPEWGKESSWMEIQSNPKGGYFSGRVTWSGGWYELEVRGRKGEQIIGSGKVNRVGIGEVFLVAGQSNAQGFNNLGSTNANDERVIRATYNGIDGPNEPLPYPAFDRIAAESVISPRGFSAWTWGRLGDNLAARLNVPVLFYNAGWDGSGVKSWRESITGQAWSVYDSNIPFVPTGMPYGNFRNLMQNYVAVTGVRAVLWQQGEADNDTRTSQSSYFAELETLINHTRAEFGKNLSWVVARTSYTYRSGVGVAVINAQNAIINNVSNVFAGPETDNIQIPRYDGYHFRDAGLSMVAEAWATALNDDFFSRSVPHQPEAPLPVNVTCGADNKLTLSIQGAFHNVSWSNGGSGVAVTVGQGTYQARARDEAGNYLFSPRIQVPANVTAQAPTITSEGIAEVCVGGSLTLNSSDGNEATWSNGKTGKQITANEPGDYFVTIRNVYECQATSPKFTVALRQKQLPAAPTITAEGATTFCDGKEVILSSSTGTNTVWSNGVNEQKAAIKTSGQFTARTRDSEGCFSPVSNAIAVKVNALPAKPRVSESGSTTFCDGGNVVLTSSYSDGNTWNTSSTAQAITIAASGTYSVTYKDGNGCENTSASVAVKVNPLPAAPVISSVRPTTFCDRDYTILTSNIQPSYKWSNGATSREVRVTTSGAFTLTTTDANGCTSKASAVTTVTVNPLPAKPVITAQTATTFCANESATLAAPSANSYKWSDGSTTQQVAFRKAGTYTVRVGNQFGCLSDASDGITLQTIPIPSTPVIVANGKTDFCEGGKVVLAAQGNPPFEWSTKATSITLDVTKSGTYTARTKGTNGCFSNASNSINVLVRKQPATPVIEKTGVFTLSAHTDIPATFNWQKDKVALAGETTASIKVTQSASFSAQAFVKYTDVLTCFSPYSEAFLFFLDANSNSFNIYPNPNFDGNLFVESAEDLQNATVVLYNSRGQLVATFTGLHLNEKRELKLPMLAAGIYIVKITAGNFTATEKLVVNP